MTFAYLGALVFSIGGLVFLDHRLRLALFDKPRAALLTVGLAVAAFLAWDLAGVRLGIFFIGDAPYQSGVLIAPEVPLEEVFFLILLTYQTLLLWRWLDRRARARSGAEEAE